MPYIQRIHVQSHYSALVRKGDQARIDTGKNSASVNAIYTTNPELEIDGC